MERETLPFPDKYFDFIYCRHVVEDILYPFKFFPEMSRVGKAGYIETPSVLAELCRGIDAGSPPWRGYHHHHGFVWNDNGTLKLLKKYPIIEYTEFDDATIEAFLRNNPKQWDAYLLWKNAIKVDEIRMPPGSPQYGDCLAEAASQNIDSTNQYFPVRMCVNPAAAVAAAG